MRIREIRAPRSPQPTSLIGSQVRFGRLRFGDGRLSEARPFLSKLPCAVACPLNSSMGRRGQKSFLSGED